MGSDDGDLGTRPTVPGYRLTRRLGAGGVGTVWAAVRDADGAGFAVKVVPCPDDGAARTAAREAALLGRVRVEGLVGLHEAMTLDTEPPSVALVLDRLEGGSVAAAVRARGHLSAGELVTVLTPVARTLAGLHAVGVVHGDLSPANVLLELTGRPRVCDLGLARLTGERVTDPFGTDGYVAPELLDRGAPTPASDVYALGALAWFCATGSPPGPGAIRGRLVDLAPGLPESWRRTTLDALAADVRRRPTAAEAAVAYFESAPADPLRLVVGADEASLLTRRIRRSAAAYEAADLGHAHLADAPLDDAHLADAHLDDAHLADAHLADAHLADPPAARRHGRRRTLVAAVAGASVLAVLTWGVRGGAGSTPTAEAAAGSGASPQASSSSSSSARDGRGGEREPAASWVLADPTAPQRAPRAVMQLIADLRASAMNAADLAALRGFDAPASPALDADTVDLAGLVTTGTRYAGVTLRVRSARTVTAGATRAVVEAVVDTGAYRVLGGHETTPVRATPGSPLLFTLVLVQGQWRVFRVDPP